MVTEENRKKDSVHTPTRLYIMTAKSENTELGMTSVFITVKTTSRK